jgi:hypothetical protein
MGSHVGGSVALMHQIVCNGCDFSLIPTLNPSPLRREGLQVGFLPSLRSGEGLGGEDKA